MKKPQWDDSNHDSKEFFDTTVMLPDDDADELDDETDEKDEIEERLDGKRIDHEFEFDDLDELLDSMN